VGESAEDGSSDVHLDLAAASDYPDTQFIARRRRCGLEHVTIKVTWNQFKLTVRGTKAALEINGTPAWEADGLGEPTVGYITLQAEVPGGGQHRFRNIYLTELK
jgi:hypothetical protein